MQEHITAGIMGANDLSIDIQREPAPHIGCGRVSRTENF
jgi:cyanate lyase